MSDACRAPAIGIEIVVVQPTPFCNIDCSYCYLPNRSDKSVISLETIATLFTKVFASGWTLPEITVIWHAGEPLVMPVSFYRTAFDLIERLRPAEQRLFHSIQTNGTLISDDWCALFSDYDVRVGVSIDGPRHVHDARRVTRSGQGTFDRTLRGIRKLREHNVPFHIITVLSEALMDMPDALHDFYVSEGIRQICFNIEESEGQYVSDMLGLADVRDRFSRFMARFWEVSRAQGEIGAIREIDSMISRIFRPEQAEFRNVQTAPLGILTVDHSGNVSTFSPELLGYKNADYADFIIGNINSDSLAEIRANPTLLAMERDIQAGVDACRAGCEYFSICGGGAPVNKLAENGQFASTRTKFCTLIEMAMTDLILDSVERAEQSRQVGDLIVPKAPEPARL